MSARIGASRRRSSSPREQATRWTASALFAAAAVAMPALARPTVSTRTGLVLLAGAVALAVASAVELEIGSASAVPTEPVLVALLFAAPPSLVPITVLAGLGAGALVIRRRTGREESPLVTAGSAFHALGPALALTLAHDPGAAGHRWLALVLIVATQLLADLAVSWLLNCVGHGLGFGELVGMLRWSYAIDATLAPTGLLAWIAFGPTTATFAVALFPVALVALLAVDREHQMDRLVALGTAYDDAHLRARRDALTSLGNRLAWNEAVQAARAAATQPVAVVLLDVDRLKEVNDQYGHDAGDRLLRTVGAVVAAQVPPGALACRIGGDEFGVLLSGAMASAHRSVADAIVEGAARRPHIGELAVSVSVGSSVAAASSVLDTIQLADDALYGAKRAGRERHGPSRAPRRIDSTITT